MGSIFTFIEFHHTLPSPFGGRRRHCIGPVGNRLYDDDGRTEFHFWKTFSAAARA